MGKRAKVMKLISGLLIGALSQYEPSHDDPAYSNCGPSAEKGGAYWPSLSAEHPCGVQFWSEQVAANSKCMLQLTAGFSYFLTLGGVFVTSPASDYYADTFYFHTYDNWVGQQGASVVNFWQNADFPSNASCHNADAICITCTEEPDADYDGYPDMVQGVYLGNFMHDFRHAGPSHTNVPIANSAGHVNGTVYTVHLYDQYGQPAPVTDIQSHYAHAIGAPIYDDGTYYSNNGVFTIHVGCTDFEGQFLYFSFSHLTDVEANGWYSWVEESFEVLDCPEVVNWESAESEVAPAEAASSEYAQADSYSDPYAQPPPNPYPSGTSGNRNKNKNKRPKRPNQRTYDYNNGTEYAYDDAYYYDDSSDNYNYNY